MQVNPAPRVEISSDQGAFLCDNFTVTFTAQPFNAGANPAYQWRKDGEAIPGANASTLTLTEATLTNQSNIDVVMSTTVNCADPTAVSNPINIQVATTVEPQVSIRALQTGGLCAGGEATFAVEEVFPPDLNALYTWRVDGQVRQQGPGNSFNAGVLSNGQTVQLEYLSSLSCAQPPSAFSNVITVQTETLSPPTNLVVETVSANTLTLQWQDNSLGETRFEIFRSVGDDQNFQLYNFTLGNQFTFVDQVGLLPNTTYYYRVRAVNGNITGCVSDFTETVGATTDEGGLVTALPVPGPEWVRVFPNPSADGLFRFRFAGVVPNGLTLVERNAWQQVVRQLELRTLAPGQDFILDLGSEAAGVYSVQLYWGEQSRTVRLVKF